MTAATGSVKEAMLNIEHLSISYGPTVTLKDVNCRIHKGDVICIIGPSGCGKSTFINCLNRMVEPTGGRVLFHGEEITAKTDLCALRQKMGMVFQSYNLFPHLTILENMVMAPRDLLGMNEKDAQEKALGLLKSVGLADRWDSYPTSLSGGQQQRVAIVRALMMEPEILLLDEPTSALDPAMVGEVEAVLRDLAEQGLTMVIVTHSMSFAKKVANRVFFMDEGVIYEEGTPHQVLKAPVREKTRWFVRQMKVFDQRIYSRDFDFLSAVTALTAYGQRQRIGSALMQKLHLLFEEFCAGLVVPALEKPEVGFTVAYDEETESAEVVIEYNGPRQDFLAKADEISQRLICAAADSMEYQTDGGKEQIVLSVCGKWGGAK